MTGCPRLFRELVRFLCAAVRTALLSAALCFGASGPVLAQQVAPSAAMTASDLGALFDEHTLREMQQADVAGAAIAVVKDGAVVFARGYGYADVERKVPVSPSHTLFRIASVSKVITYTAVMQLVEQGKIDLDADIGRYLDFPIPAAFDKAITMRHLMAHTAGFEDTMEDRWVKPGDLGSLRDYLVRRMPRRLFAPGTVPAYSSYGTTLAGYVVERVSGEPFEAYVEKHIFAPAGMRHSSFAQPLSGYLAPMLAKGYMTGSGPARAFDTAQIAPAASMSSSAMDMARFMLAHLGGASATGQPLLTPASLARMHTVQFRHHPAGPGMALGVYEMDEVAPRLLGHMGDIPGFHAAMYLFPERRLGLFIVQNTETGGAMRHKLLKVFAERYLSPPGQPAAARQDLAADETGRIPGSYRASWRFDSSPLSVKFLFEQSLVRMVEPGTLVIDTHVGLDGKPIEWHQVGPGVWQSAANPLRRLYFSKSAQGDWEMSSSRNPIYIMQKSPWYQHKLLVLVVLPTSIVLILLSVLGWPLSVLFQGRSSGAAALSPQSRKLRNAVRLAGVLALTPWLVYAGIALLVMRDLLFAASPACGMLLRVTQLLAWCAVAGAIVAAWAASVSLRTPGTPWMRRLHHALLALACLGATAMAWLSNLLFWDGRF